MHCGFFSVNVKNPRGYQFTLNRLSLVKSPETDELLFRINHHIHNAYRDFLVKYNAYNPPEIYRLCEEVRHNSHSSPSLSPDTLKKVIEDGSDLLYVKLIRVDRKTNYISSVPEYVLISEINTKTYDVLHTQHTSRSGGSMIELEKTPDILFEIAKEFANNNTDIYILGSHNDAKLIAKKDPLLEYYVLNISLRGSPPEKIPFFLFNTKNIDISRIESASRLIIRGLAWAGFVEERKIQGAPFIFITRQHLVIQKGSKMMFHIKDLLGSKSNNAASLFIKKIEDYEQGFDDGSITAYTEEELK